MTCTFPPRGRLAGIDYGTARIGVAVTDPGRTLASPHGVYARRGEAADAEWFRRFAAEEQIVGFVVGLPVHQSGQPSEASRAARQFGNWLAQTTATPVCFYDERYSTLEADQLLSAAKLTRKQRKRRLDMLAAQIMLSAYLESNRAANHDPGPLAD